MIITAMMVYLLGTGSLVLDWLTGIGVLIAFGADYFLASRIGSAGSEK